MRRTAVVMAMLVAFAASARGQVPNPEERQMQPPPEARVTLPPPTGTVGSVDADLGPGDRAPDFQIDSSHGGTMKRADLLGHWSVLVFDESRSRLGVLAAVEDSIGAMGVQLFGVCRDAVPALRMFAEREKLRLALLSDPTGQISQLFGMYDDANEAIQPGLVIVDGKGIVRMVVQGPALHGNDALQMVQHVVRGS